ncbi:Dolichyl-diphosphooligosaccharide-protein glycosyltransferase subunit dad1 [Turnera subulata]|uniref:Dolichyl-diphosphooligosaccharide-protein glycosyltransferase subunit dad1 n=1 Tax=Turnera subulata TaxID=218843 RepID=A0A9Q0GCB0_9ROSI|nr:Dolichyl-diphosphooligosaccharide-protein glycosyltransferase subunit dad1 [Turnera subulata]
MSLKAAAARPRLLPNSAAAPKHLETAHQYPCYSPFPHSSSSSPTTMLNPSPTPYSSQLVPLRHLRMQVSSSMQGKTNFLTCDSVKLGKKWMEYQGANNWEGMLDPLDDNLRSEILRYGMFVEAAYRSFDFDPSSPTYATSKFPKSTLLSKSGIGQTGYRMTKNLKATCGIQLPRWFDRAPSWVSTQSSWIGYVAVCQDKEEISRLGRRDVVIAYRGTATCLEWLENLRATLACLPGDDEAGPMVETGFLSLYTSRTAKCPSLQDSVRREIARILEKYGDEPLSITITGHSLGAALATLTAHDINRSFPNAPMTTVISFGGPRVGNKRFRCQLEESGTRILRIVNSDDLITKVPGFVVDNNDVADSRAVQLAAGLPCWLQKRVEDTLLAYAEVGQELRLSSKQSPFLKKLDIATCHELSTYLHLVNGFVSSTCPFRATAKKVLNQHREKKLRLR